MAVFYQQSFVNYRGRTSDTDEYYTEVIAEWCCGHLDYFEQIPQITRETSYQVAGHDGLSDNAMSNRTEEMIAMAMYRQGELPLVGKVIDYQTPLKNKRSDRAGKIDLLAYTDSTLRILELKEPESTETMLRCVLEGYTYLRTVNPEKLVSDFCLPSGTQVLACPFIFAGKAQHHEMLENRPQLKRLMRSLNSKPYYIRHEKERFLVAD